MKLLIFLFFFLFSDFLIAASIIINGFSITDNSNLIKQKASALGYICIDRDDNMTKFNYAPVSSCDGIDIYRSFLMIHCKLTKTCDKDLKFVANMLIQNKIVNSLKIEWDDNLATQYYWGRGEDGDEILVYEKRIILKKGNLKN